LTYISAPYLCRIENGLGGIPKEQWIVRFCTALRHNAELPELLQLAQAAREKAKPPDELDRAHFGKRLRALRIARGRTLKSLSQSVRKSVSYLGSIEAGWTEPPNSKLLKGLCSALNCDTEFAELNELAISTREEVALLPRANSDTHVEVRQMLVQLRRSLRAGRITPTAANEIARILQASPNTA
jgi:transcriptional regulator with XRE-family HTH domain